VSSSSGEPSEEEIRAALEEEMKRVHVQDVVLQSVVSLVNLGARRAGLAPGTEGEKDLEQTRLAIDAVRAVLPLLEERAPEQVSAIRDAISQLQMAYVRAGGTPPAGSEGGEPGSGPSGSEPHPDRQPEQRQDPGAGRAQSSGRLWVPGQ
jgi:hypothetical protein